MPWRVKMVGVGWKTYPGVDAGGALALVYGELRGVMDFGEINIETHRVSGAVYASAYFKIDYEVVVDEKCRENATIAGLCNLTRLGILFKADENLSRTDLSI